MGIWTTHRQRQAGRYAKASYNLARREAIANHRAREVQRLATRTVLIRRRNELLAELAAQTPPRPDLEEKRLAFGAPSDTPSIR